MRLKPVMLSLGAACLALAAALGVSALRFVADTAQTRATVSAVDARNDRCGRTRKSHRKRYDCTAFTATLRFVHAGAQYTATVPAGRVKGHDRPPSLADARVGQTLPILYRASAPAEEVYRADRGAAPAIWGKSALAALFGVVFVFIGVAGGRRNRRR